MNKIYYSKILNEKFFSKLKEKLSHEFHKCRKIAIKIHFGEPGNKNAFTPEQIKPITEILNNLT